ncbi:GtrA family protein [Paenibacillus sp. MER 78]|nr:GtrA family protein [Paenibacillus sp. MER 78]
MNKTSMQALKFLMVGVLNTSIDLAIFFVLSIAGLPILLAQCLSYSCGLVNSYLINRKWTFQRAEKQSMQELLKFIGLNILTLGVVSLLLLELQSLGNQSLTISKVIATTAGILINYLGSRYWVFRVSQAKGGKSHES